MSNNPYEPPTTRASTLTGEADASKYLTYDQVPVFRRQWVFWLAWLIFAPIALAILLSGDVYYVKKGKVVPFGTANKVLGGLLSLAWIYQVIQSFVS